MDNEYEEKAKTHGDLNRDAAKLIKKNVDRSTQWEKDLGTKMLKIEQTGKANVM